MLFTASCAPHESRVHVVGVNNDAPRDSRPASILKPDADPRPLLIRITLTDENGQPIAGVPFAAVASTPLERGDEIFSEPTDEDGRAAIRLGSIPSGPRVLLIVPGIDFHEGRAIRGEAFDPALARHHMRASYTLRLGDEYRPEASIEIVATPATSLRGELLFIDDTGRPATDNFIVFSSRDRATHEHNTVEGDAYTIPRVSATDPGTIAFFVPEARETPLLLFPTDGLPLNRPEQDAGVLRFEAPEATLPLRFTHGPASLFDFAGVHMHDAVFYWMFASWIAEDGTHAHVFQTADPDGRTVHWAAEGETRIAPGRYFVVPGNAAYGDEITSAVLAAIARGEQGRLREMGVPWVEVPENTEGDEAFEYTLDPVGTVERLIDRMQR